MMLCADFFAAARREFAFLRGSVVDQLLWIWSPLVAVGLILWLFSGGIPAGLPISVVDQDQSASSRELIRRLSASRSVRVALQAASMEEAWPQIRSAGVYAVVQVPSGWEVERLRGGQKPVVLYNNLQFYLVAGLVSSAVRDTVASLAGEQAILREARFGGGLDAARQRTTAVRADLRTLFNPQISYELYLGGMLTPLILHIYLVVMVVSAFGREFRNRSVAAWLEASNGRLMSAVLGKCLPALCLHFVLGLGLMGILTGLGGSTLGGNFAWWMGSMALMTLVSIALAVFLFSLTGDLRIALSSVGVFVATAPAFSGFTFPLDAMGWFGNFWGHLLPITYYLELQQGQWMSGASLQAWAQGMLWLAAFGAFYTLVGIPMLKRQIANPKRWGRL
jgi:ABC-2 type transport system permease protein